MGLIINSFFIAAPPVVVTPASFAGLTRWYKADSFALADGTAIGGGGNTWTDLSAFAAPLSQAAVGQRPVFKTNIVGTMPVVRFSPGSSQYLSMTAVGLSAYTFIVIGSFNSDSMTFGSDAFNYQVRVKRSGANNMSNYFGGSDVQSTALTNPANTIRMLTWRRNGGVCTWRENTTSASIAADSGDATPQFNAFGRASFGGFLDGDIGEMVAYDNELSDANLDSLYNDYFKARWSLP